MHHYFGGRKEVYVALLERLGAVREEQLRPPVGRSARSRVADSVSRWLDWTEANRTMYLGTIAPGEDIADPDVRRVVADLVRRAVALVADFHARHRPGLVLRLRLRVGTAGPALKLVRATRRWLRGEATRETTHELLTSYARNTSCARSALLPRPTGQPNLPLEAGGQRFLTRSPPALECSKRRYAWTETRRWARVSLRPCLASWSSTTPRPDAATSHRSGDGGRPGRRDRGRRGGGAAGARGEADDLLDADGYVLGTTANFGYMTGALKHVFDTIFLQTGGALADDGTAAGTPGPAVTIPTASTSTGATTPPARCVPSRRSRGRCPGGRRPVLEALGDRTRPARGGVRARRAPSPRC